MITIARVLIIGIIGIIEKRHFARH